MTTRMGVNTRRVGRAMAAIAAVAGVYLAGAPATAQTYGLATMQPGTLAHTTGTAIAKVLKDKGGLNTLVQTTAGETVLIPMVAKGEIDLGVANLAEVQAQVEGSGDWLDALRYDIRATMAPGTTREQFDLMVQDLLRERFGLRVHREIQERTTYVLSIAKGGAKLKDAAVSGARPGIFTEPIPGGSEMQGINSGIQLISHSLETALRGESAIVRDQTGLTGTYDFKIRFASGELTADSVPLPSLATTLEQDLGLKIEKTKAQVEVLVVDHIEKVPTEN